MKDKIEKIILIIPKDQKKIAINRMSIKMKIEINKFDFLWKGEIEKKSKFNKKT